MTQAKIREDILSIVRGNLAWADNEDLAEMASFLEDRLTND